MHRKNVLAIVAVVMFATGIGQVGAATVTVLNGDFELIYKPGTMITGILLPAGGAWTQGVGPDCPIDSGTYKFSDTSTGYDADVVGWLGYDRDGWIALGGTYGRDQTTGNLQGCVANVNNLSPGGLNCYCVNGSGWGNAAGGLITSDESLGTILSNSIYTLSMYARGEGTGATPVVLELFADGALVTPTSSVSPALTSGWQEFTRTYDVADLSSYVGQAMTIVLGVGRNAIGSQTQFDDVSFSYEVTLQANDPVPANESGHIALGQTLSWTGPSQGDPTYDLYFSSTDPDLGPATQKLFGSGSIGYDPDLDYATVYYWRVDVHIGIDVYTGNPWTFTTGGKASDPVPGNGQENVPGFTVDLSWTGDVFADSYKVYAGTTFPLSYIDEVSACQYMGLATPEELTTYHWRVDEYIGTQMIAPGDPWHFTTSPGALEAPAGDLTGDWAVGLDDLEIFAGQWLDGPGCVGHPDDCADLVGGGDGVDMADFGVLSANWLDSVNLKINESMASNVSIRQDDHGEYDDWIEIYNPKEISVDIGGMYLTDDLSEPTKWQIPSDSPGETTISPQGYLLLWADGQPEQGPLHLDFGLENTGEEIGLFTSDGGTLIDSVVYGWQISDISFGRYPDATNNSNYFDQPTPGAENVGGYIGLVAEPEFSVERGFYDEPFSVVLTCPTDGATMHYTFGSSEPTEASTEYTAPIAISETKCLRVAAFKPGYLPSVVVTHTYIFVADVIDQAYMSTAITDDPVWGPQMADALLEIPTISLVTGNLISELEKETSIEMIFPDGSAGFQANVGVEHFGSHALDNYPKKSMRISFKGIYGPSELKFDLFGGCPYGGSDATDEFDQFLLRAGSHDTLFWTNPNTGSGGIYVRNRWIMDRQLEMGHPAPRGRFVHVYINGIYWGQYHLMERPNAPFMASYFGGDKEDYDALKSGVVIDGNANAWNTMLASLGDYQAAGEYVDIVNFIDYMILNYYGGNDWDWSPYYNWMAGRKREMGHTFKFYCWDNDMIMRTGLYADVTSSGGPGNICSALKGHEEFRILMADRAQKHFFNDGMLTRDRIQADLTELGYSVERTIIPECARWNEWDGSGSYTPDTFQQHLDWVKYDIANERTNVVIEQMRSAGMFPSIDAPTFSKHGGEIAPTEPLSMTAPAGVIWYTIDGEDPRVFSGGGGSSTATTLLNEDAAKTVLIPTEINPSDDTWRSDYSFDDGTWISGIGGVGYESGSGYESYIDIDVKTPMDDVNTTCYIRIPFTFAGDPGDFNYMTLKMRYDDGFVAYLNGTKVEEVNFSGEPAWDSQADTYREAGAVFDDFDISDHLGELQTGNNLLAIHGLNDALSSSDFLICVELEAGEDIPGNVSASAIQYTGPINLTQSTCLKAGALSDGTWSALNEAVFAVGPVVENLRITEIMYNPADLNAEYIELKNIGVDTINIGLVRFTNGIDFTFPSHELAAGEYVLVAQDPAALAAVAPSIPPGVGILGPYTGLFDNAGEKIKLVDAIGRTIHEFNYKDGWYEITDGIGFSLTIKDPTNVDLTSWDDKAGWRPSASIGGSPGEDDSGQVPELGAIKINELLAHSDVVYSYDWIELYNTTGAPINIGGWYLSDDANNLKKYTIPEGTSIDAYDYCVFYENLHFGIGNPADPANVPFALSENGETLYLNSGQGGVLTGYSEEEAFDASQADVPFGRYQKSTGTFNFVAMSSPTPGWANAYPKVGPVVISEIMYNPLTEGDAEYVELLNISGSTVTLQKWYPVEGINVPWRFTDSGGITYDFPLGTTMDAGEKILLVKNLIVFESEFGGSVPGDKFEWGEGKLDNGGEKIELSIPGDLEGLTRYYIQVDRINYSDGSHPVGDDPWPTEPDGTGQSLTRKVPSDYGNDVANWQSATPSPGG